MSQLEIRQYRDGSLGIRRRDSLVYGLCYPTFRSSYVCNIITSIGLGQKNYYLSGPLVLLLA